MALHEKEPTPTNRTGTKLHPEHTKVMREGAALAKPSLAGDRTLGDRTRAIYIKSSHAPGTMPPPTKPLTLPELVLDYMSARLAYERTAMRYIESLLIKLEQLGSFPGGPAPEQLTRIRNEKMQQFNLLATLIEQHGGDPTALTPMANVALGELEGVGKVIADPRMLFSDGLHALMVGELANAEAWTELVDTALASGSQIGQQLPEANGRAQEHATTVRDWMRAYGRSRVAR